MDQIDLSGPPLPFTVNLVQKALDYGQLDTGLPAIVSILDQLCESVGIDKQSEITRLKQIVLRSFSQHSAATPVTDYLLSRVDQWSHSQYQLDTKFVYLTILIDRTEDNSPRWVESENLSFNNLIDILDEFPTTPAFVLLGPPGSGKSTLLRRFQLDDSLLRLRDGGDRLTWLVPLSNYKTNPTDGSPLPYDWLEEKWTRFAPQLPCFNEFLGTGRLVLLLDGLNEMPHRELGEYQQKIRLWREFLKDMAQNSPGSRAILTCRSLNYSASLSSKDMSVPQVVIQPMTNNQMQLFLRTYAPSFADSIWTDLRNTPQLEIFRNPYSLNLLTKQIKTDGRIPKNRAELFTSFIRQLLNRELEGENSLFNVEGILSGRDYLKVTQRKWRDAYELPEEGYLFRNLRELAFRMQQQIPNTAGAQVRIARSQAIALLDQGQGATVLDAATGLNVMDEDLAFNEVFYSHQLLQEYFAGRQLAREPDPNLVKTEWRATKIVPSLDETVAELQLDDPLPPPPSTGWEETTILAASMTPDAEAFIKALLETNLPIAARCAAEPGIEVSETTKTEIKAALISYIQNREVDLRSRIAAGLAIKYVGDLRFECHSGPEGNYLLPPFINISGGVYWIGSDTSSYDFERPRHTVKLPAFRIGKYPVTNAEYAFFILSGGYRDERWWQLESAKVWLSGEEKSQRSKQIWRENRAAISALPKGRIRELAVQTRISQQQADDWAIIENWSDEDFENWLNKTFPGGQQFTQPALWDDENYNNPSQPVVGITWYEALAYCAWLSAQTGHTFRLPTEAEWEAAARGFAEREFAFGMTFDIERCNTFERHIRRPAPVGIFPDGESPEGLVDMVGNTYDWTSSIYDQEQFPYPYRADDGREDINRSDAYRVLRGGSWFSRCYAARSAYRYYFDPVGRDFDQGLRLVSDL